MLMSGVESGKCGNLKLFFEKIWKNPCTIQKKIVPLHLRLRTKFLKASGKSVSACNTLPRVFNSSAMLLTLGKMKTSFLCSRSLATLQTRKSHPKRPVNLDERIRR